MKFGFVPSEREGMSGKRTMAGPYCYQGYPGKGQQHSYTTPTNEPPRVETASTLSYFLVHVSTESPRMYNSFRRGESHATDDLLSYGPHFFLQNTPILLCP